MVLKLGLAGYFGGCSGVAATNSPGVAAGAVRALGA